MFKIETGIVLILTIIILGGCSAAKRKRTVAPEYIDGASTVLTIVREACKFNITDDGFVIKRGRIELEGTETDGNFGYTARLNGKGDFFATVKGPLGIELVRILIVGNDVALINRLNRTVLVGRKDLVMNKNGVPEDFIKILFGDIATEAFGWDVKSTGINTVTLIRTDAKYEREVSICVDEMKVCGERIRSLSRDMEIALNFSAFMRSGDLKYPAAIVLYESDKNIRVKLSIDDFVPGYGNEIEFNLPDYRRESL